MPSSFEPFKTALLNVRLFLCIYILPPSYGVYPSIYFNFHYHFLLSLQCWNDTSVSICWHLNLMFSILNKPSTVLHASCSACLKASRNCQPCLTRHILIIGTLSAWFVAYIWKMLHTSSLKFFSSAYQSVMLQVKDSHLSGAP